MRKKTQPFHSVAGDAVDSTLLDAVPRSPRRTGEAEVGRDGITLLPVAFQNNKNILCLEMSFDYTLTDISSSALCQNDFIPHPPVFL